MQLRAYQNKVNFTVKSLIFRIIRVRFHIIGNARIENVGKYQSRTVSKLPIIWKQTVGVFVERCDEYVMKIGVFTILHPCGRSLCPLQHHLPLHQGHVLEVVRLKSLCVAKHNCKRRQTLNL